MKSLYLKPGREKPLLQRHPWIFSGAVGRVEGQPESGETVAVRAAGGSFLAWAAYSPASQIRARVWTWQEEEAVDAAFFRLRLGQALELRQALIGESDAYRLVHAESDGLPGLVVDRYGPLLALQFLSAGAERWRDVIVEALVDVTGHNCLYERSDVEVRSLEGLAARSGVLRGEPPAERLVIHEGGLAFYVDVQSGQKTGFYLDQRPNRQVVRRLAGGRRVLNCFCYSGGFTAAALAGGAAEALSVDSSAGALALARENLALNGLPPEKAAWLEGDVFQALRRLRDRRESFDMVILDPPKFAPTAAQVERAGRAYKDINLLAFKLLNRGGLLVTFSCSGGVSSELFQKIVAGAALDAQAEARVIERLSAGADHPAALSFPEGEYLKGLVCRVG